MICRGKSWCGLRAACEPLFKQGALESYTPTINQVAGFALGLPAAICMTLHGSKGLPFGSGISWWATSTLTVVVLERLVS